MEMFEEERVDAIASVPCKASITVIGVHVGCTTAQDATVHSHVLGTALEKPVSGFLRSVVSSEEAVSQYGS